MPKYFTLMTAWPGPGMGFSMASEMNSEEAGPEPFSISFFPVVNMFTRRKLEGIACLLLSFRDIFTDQNVL